MARLARPQRGQVGITPDFHKVGPTMSKAQTGKSLNIGIIALCLALFMMLAGRATAEDSPVNVGGALGLNWVYGDYTGDRGTT